MAQQRDTYVNLDAGARRKQQDERGGVPLGRPSVPDGEFRGGIAVMPTTLSPRRQGPS